MEAGGRNEGSQFLDAKDGYQPLTPANQSSTRIPPGDPRDGYNTRVGETLLPPPILISEAEALLRLAAILAGEPHLAVDTESNSLHAYRERVCLIQFSTPGADYLVDPPAVGDLSALKPVFSNPSVEKVLHAAEYDVICLKRDFGIQLANLFDTRVACRTLGQCQAGLGDLLEQEFDVHLNKRYQRADWGQRPLPADLLDYARLDTHYLLPLRHRMAEALQAAGRWEEASEECERLTRVEPRNNGLDPQGFWHIGNARHLPPVQAAVLQRVYLLREEIARRADRPPFKILGDKTLLAVAQTCPSNLEALQELPGMTPGQMRRYGESLLEAVSQGLNDRPPRPPAIERVEEAVVARHETLRAWRKRVAEARHVESDVILPREVLWEIARLAPRTPAELEAVIAPLHWRFREYGGEILHILWG